jgi:hypothetical protein
MTATISETPTTDGALLTTECACVSDRLAALQRDLSEGTSASQARRTSDEALQRWYEAHLMLEASRRRHRALPDADLEKAASVLWAAFAATPTPGAVEAYLADQILELQCQGRRLDSARRHLRRNGS